jgi:hypothetical protein
MFGGWSSATDALQLIDRYPIIVLHQRHRCRLVRKSLFDSVILHHAVGSMVCRACVLSFQSVIAIDAYISASCTQHTGNMVETDAYVVEKYRKFVRHMML